MVPLQTKTKNCSWCGNDISTLKSNAVYCSTTCRTAAHRAAPCFYCGMPAAEREHVVPRSKRRYQNNHTVPTCYECNRLAGVEIFETVEEKRSFIQKRILNKYKKIINMPDWSQQDLDELGPALKGHVMATIELKQLIAERLAYRGK